VLLIFVFYTLQISKLFQKILDCPDRILRELFPAPAVQIYSLR